MTLAVVLPPGERESGKLSPLTLNSPPVTLALQTVRVALPELLSVTFRAPLLPTVTSPKLMLVGFKLSRPWVPVPLRESEVGEFGALLVKERLPVAAPAVAGLKVTSAVVVPPEGRLSGRVIPLTLKPLPVTLALEMVMGALSELLRVTLRVALWPTETSPKSMPAGLRLSCPSASTTIPVPVSERLVGELSALLGKETLPVTVPATEGANPAKKEAELPFVRVKGKVRPERLKPEPVMVGWVTVTSPVPVFFSVMICELLSPTRTLPKSRVAGVTEIWKETGLIGSSFGGGSSDLLNVQAVEKATNSAAAAARFPRERSIFIAKPPSFLAPYRVRLTGGMIAFREIECN